MLSWLIWPNLKHPIQSHSFARPYVRCDRGYKTAGKEEESQKSRSDRRAYPDDGIAYRKKGNLVANAVSRTQSQMACVAAPNSKPVLRRKREIEERDQCGNSSETSQPYRTLGSMHSTLHLKIIKFKKEKDGRSTKRRIKLPRRRFENTKLHLLPLVKYHFRGASANAGDDDDSEDEDSRRNHQHPDEDIGKAHIDPLDEIRIAHARRNGAYLGSGKHIPVHSAEFVQLQHCLLEGSRRVKGVKAGHSSTMYLSPRTVSHR